MSIQDLLSLVCGGRMYMYVVLERWGAAIDLETLAQEILILCHRKEKTCKSNMVSQFDTLK